MALVKEGKMSSNEKLAHALFLFNFLAFVGGTPMLLIYFSILNGQVYIPYYYIYLMCPGKCYSTAFGTLRKLLVLL
jgi:hypothetical protein